MRTIGINQSCIMQARLEEFIPACAGNGIHEVELRVPKLVDAHYRMSSASITAMLEQNGMTVTSVNSLEDFGLVPDDNLPILRREVETLVHYCRTCGTDLVVAPVARWYDTTTDAEWIKATTADRLRFVADILEPLGISVGFEPIAYDTFTIWSLEESLEIIERSGASNVSLVADVYNLARGSSNVESLRHFGKQISLIHVNDAPHSRLDELDLVSDRTFPQTGILDPRRWVEAAIDGGFDGPVSIEIFPDNVWEMEIAEAAALCAEHTKRFGALL
jgi:sugar phosphate isomerase/epimerase